jgi:hypothetical protein
MPEAVFKSLVLSTGLSRNYGKVPSPTVSAPVKMVIFSNSPISKSSVMNNLATPRVQVRPISDILSTTSAALIDDRVSLLRCDPMPPGFQNKIPYEPLVALYHNPELLNTYDLFIIAYIPKGATGVRVEQDISHLEPMDTEAGEMSPRIISIAYTNPPTDIEPLEYEQYQYFIQYTVDGHEAPAVCVQYEIDDPKTSRGTVTVVRITR